jgi:hypothetical protein
VQLRFGPDDLDAFASVKGQLLDEFRPWADDQAQEMTFDDLIEDMWRHDQPETVEVLEALGRHLTDKQMAKAARKAVVKHRSWLANR